MAKKFNVMYNVGKVKYLVNFHDGESTHPDGSEFFSIATFSNKKDFKKFQKKLCQDGYEER